MGRGTTRDRSLLQVINRAIFGRELEDLAPRRRETVRTTTKPIPRERHRHRKPVEYHDPRPASDRDQSEEETEEESNDGSSEGGLPVRVKQETTKRVYAAPDASQRRSIDSVDSDSDQSQSSTDALRRSRSQPIISKSESRRERVHRSSRETKETTAGAGLRRAYTDIKDETRSRPRDAGEISPRKVGRPTHGPRPPIVSSRHSKKEEAMHIYNSPRRASTTQPPRRPSPREKIPSPPPSPEPIRLSRTNTKHTERRESSDIPSRTASREETEEDSDQEIRPSRTDTRREGYISSNKPSRSSTLREQVLVLPPPPEPIRLSRTNTKQPDRHRSPVKLSRDSSREDLETSSDEEPLPRHTDSGRERRSPEMLSRSSTLREEFPHPPLSPEPMVRLSRSNTKQPERRPSLDKPEPRVAPREKISIPERVRRPETRSRTYTREPERVSSSDKSSKQPPKSHRREKHTKPVPEVRSSRKSARESERHKSSSKPSKIPTLEKSAKPVEPEKLFECVVCLSDDIPRNQSVKLKCGHRQCHDCLKRLFKLSVKDPQHMPPKCCTADCIPVKHVEKLFSPAFKKTWNYKFQEFTTKNRIYCPGRRCGEWIKPGNIRKKDGYGKCGRCKLKVCVLCCGKWHEGKECPKDEATNNLLEAAKQAGWQRCYNCRTLVELKEGCNHMTCRCTAEFCMICGLKWKSCNCPWFNYEAVEEDRLRHMQVPQDIPFPFLPFGDLPNLNLNAGGQRPPWMPPPQPPGRGPPREFPQFPHPQPPPPPPPAQPPEQDQRLPPPRWNRDERPELQRPPPPPPPHDTEEETERRRTRQERRQRRERQLDEEQRIQRDRHEREGRMHRIPPDMRRPPEYNIEYTLDGLARSIPAADRVLQEFRDQRVAQLLQQRLWLHSHES